MSDFFLTNLELRESDERGEVGAGLSHSSMKGMVLLTVLELAARGEPRGAVTILHDAGDSGDRYQDLARALAQDGWALALPDLRGHGRSEGLRGHSAGLREVERDVEEVLNHLAYRMPDAPKVLMGIGLGALQAAHFARTHEDALAALILVNPYETLPFERPAAPRGLGKLFKKLTPTSMGCTGIRGEHLSSQRAEQARFDEGNLTHSAISLRAIEEAERALQEFCCSSEFALPTLLIRSGADPLVRAASHEALASRVESCLDLAGARHHPFQDEGRDSAAAGVCAWLDRVLPR